MLLVGRAALATGWIPVAGSIVAIVLLRISPDVYAIYYNNDGISQLINVIMGLDFIEEMLSNIQISLYPAILNDMQQSRHDKKGCHAIAQCLCAIASPNLQNNPILIIFRDAQRFPNDGPFFKRFSKVANELHSNVHIAFQREGILQDAPKVKDFIVQNSNDRYALSKVASTRNVTHTLTRDEEGEEMQEDVAEYVCELSEHFPNALLISLDESTKFGDDLPSDKAIEPLRELLIQCCKEVTASTLTEEEAAKRFNTSVNSDEYSDLFSPQLLQLQNAIATRRSPGGAALTSNLLDHTDTSSFVGTIGPTTKILPATQTLHVLAALLSSDDNSATTNDLSAIVVHMEKVKRTYPLKHGLVKLLALGARDDSKMDTLAASTFTRLLTNSVEGRVALSILKSNHISLVLAYQMGFDPQSIVNKDHWRLMELAIRRSELVENLEDLSNKTISNVLTSYNIVDEDQKKAVTNQLQSFQASLKLLSNITAKRYNVGKQFKISDEHIESLSALPAITNQADLSMQTAKSVAQIPVFDILAHSLARLAIGVDAKKAPSTKLSTTVHSNKMDVDLESSMNNMRDTSDNTSRSFKRLRRVSSLTNESQNIQEDQNANKGSLDAAATTNDLSPINKSSCDDCMVDGIVQGLKQSRPDMHMGDVLLNVAGSLKVDPALVIAVNEQYGGIVKSSLQLSSQVDIDEDIQAEIDKGPSHEQDDRTFAVSWAWPVDEEAADSNELLEAPAGAPVDTSMDSTVPAVNVAETVAVRLQSTEEMEVVDEDESTQDMDSTVENEIGVDMEVSNSDPLPLQTAPNESAQAITISFSSVDNTYQYTNAAMSIGASVTASVEDAMSATGKIRFVSIIPTL